MISHRSAAVLLGVSGFRPGPHEITVQPGGNARNALARVHRSNDDEGDIATATTATTISVSQTSVSVGPNTSVTLRNTTTTGQ